MQQRSVFLFDSTYPSAELAVPIDETAFHVVVSDREIEPPPGHDILKLEEIKGPRSFGRNLRLLRAAWCKTYGGKCIVIAAPLARKEQILSNTLLALSLSRNVALFDGISFQSPLRSWRLLLRAAVRALGKTALGGLKVKMDRVRCWLILTIRSHAASPEFRLLGLYDKSDSFSVSPDRIVREADGPSIYGCYTRGWYLPMLSGCRRRYTVQTKRHRLDDVSLYLNDIHGNGERIFFKDGQILDYPYLLSRERLKLAYSVTTIRETKSIERGIDLLYYTSGYYHWLLEGVPRILDLIDDGIDFTEYPLILPTLEPFHTQILEILGICPDRQVVTVGKGDCCRVRDCIFPTAYFPFGAPELDDPSGQPDGRLLKRIRDRLLERLPRSQLKDTRAPRRIYISRAKAMKRKFTAQTEAVVRSILESNGFHTVFLEDLLWSEQAELVSGAKVVFGLHGAGLANILFANAQLLLEIQNPLEARSYFALMARELNMRYAYAVGTLDGHSNNFDNITVRPESITEMLRQVDLAL